MTLRLLSTLETSLDKLLSDFAFDCNNLRHYTTVVAQGGWAEPWQTPEFDEWTIVTKVGRCRWLTPGAPHVVADPFKCPAWFQRSMNLRERVL